MSGGWSQPKYQIRLARRRRALAPGHRRPGHITETVSQAPQLRIAALARDHGAEAERLLGADIGQQVDAGAATVPDRVHETALRRARLDRIDAAVREQLLGHLVDQERAGRELRE